MKVNGFSLYKLFVGLIIYGTVSGNAVFKRNSRDSEVIINEPTYIDEGKTLLYRPNSNKRQSEEEEENSVPITSSPFKVPKINTLGTHCYDVPSSKRSTENESNNKMNNNANSNSNNNMYSTNNGNARNAAPVNMYQGKFKKRNSPYGIVYNQGRPIGILEPISQVFEFQNLYNQEQEVVPEDAFSKEKRDVMADSRHELMSRSSGVSGGKYASILANFKIGNRMKMRPLTEEVALNTLEKNREEVYKKRSTNELSQPVAAKVVKRELSDQSLNDIEDNLKEIMSNLGLTESEGGDSSINKRDTLANREAIAEDEDLEKGVNKIGLTKETHFERNKKEDCPGKHKESDDESKRESKTLRKGNELPSSDDTLIEGEPAAKTSKKVAPNKIIDLRSEGEAFIRKKRQQQQQQLQNSVGETAADIMKGLESSGDLTVSGNKSPLASSSSSSAASEPNETQAPAEAERTVKTERSDNSAPSAPAISGGDNSDYEKRLQRNIQTKISEIKDQVKREVRAMKQTKAIAKDLKNEVKKETKEKSKRENKIETISSGDKKKRNDNEASKAGPTEQTKQKEANADEKTKKRNENVDAKQKRENEKKDDKKLVEIDKKVDEKKVAKNVKKKRENKVDVKKKIVDDGKKAGRAKRNLLDADTSNFDPGVNLEDNLEPHERRRRDASADNWDVDGDASSADNEPARVTWRELSDEPSSDINKREETDGEMVEGNKMYKQTHARAMHDPSLFQFEARAKRTIDDKKDDQLANKETIDKREETKDVEAHNEKKAGEEGVLKRSVDDKKQIANANMGGEDSNSNFWGVQNQNAAKMGPTLTMHAVASRSSETKNAIAASTNGDGDAQQEFVQTSPVVLDKQQLDAQLQTHEVVAPEANKEKKRSPSDKSQLNVKQREDLLVNREKRFGDHSNLEVELHSGPSTDKEGLKIENAGDSKKLASETLVAADAATSGDKVDKRSLIQHKTVHDKKQSGDKASPIKDGEAAAAAVKDDKAKLVAPAAKIVGDSDARAGGEQMLQAKLNADTAISIENAAMDAAKFADDKVNIVAKVKGEAKLTDDKVVAAPAHAKIIEVNEDVKDDASLADDEIEDAIQAELNDDGDKSDLSDVDKSKISESKLVEDLMKDDGGDHNVKKKKRAIDGQLEDGQNNAKLSELEGNKPSSFHGAVSSSDNLAETSDNDRVNRKESLVEPDVSLDDMQRMDSANNMKRRKRRQAVLLYNNNHRLKRDDLADDNNMQFKSYRGDEDEADDESDEFDDDNFDDRTSNLIRKRAIAHEANEYDDFDEDYEPVAPQNERQQRQRLSKRNSVARDYVRKLNSDVYENGNNYLYEPGDAKRKKRQTLFADDVSSLHGGGGPMSRHLAAIRERNRQPIDANYRMKRLEKLNQHHIKDQSIAGLSESDIFGGLPQSYEGELNRFKRVKRDKFT